jgi:hypothetical protein
MRRFGWLALVLMLAAIGLSACGNDGGDGKEMAFTSDADSVSLDLQEGTPIVMKTAVNIPTGELLDGSAIGDSPFCSGGTFRDAHGGTHIGGLVDRDLHCPDGSLRIAFTPREPVGDTQAGPWHVVSGTGAYEGLTASGEMKMTYEPGSFKKGRETFTGTVLGSR